MNIIEQIKAEVERLENYYTSVEWYVEALLSFLSTLQEQPVCEELEEHIHNVWEDNPHTQWTKCPFVEFQAIARHFAQWGAEHLASARKMIEPEKKEGRTDCSSQGEVPNDSLATQIYENIPKDLEEVAENYIAPIENEDRLNVINFSGQDIKDAFIAGAQWQKEKDEKMLSVEYLKGVEFGKKDTKEQMLREAVEGVVTEKFGAISVPRCIYEKYNGQRVRIVIIKEDKQ